MLKTSYSKALIEAGCDEAGRGCLAGPVFAAAVILPPSYRNDQLNDSKKLTPARREKLREVIERDALAWSVASAGPEEIDRLNILNASILAMHRALATLGTAPQLILVDGNRFQSYSRLPHQCIVGGDGIYMAIAAASVMAKTCRDEYMVKLSCSFPEYGWDRNKGYPTDSHRRAIRAFGTTPHHRASFHSREQLTFAFG